jgi:class 3 adenylate cyclase/tetratricopeptide (TPR) repeat protein/ribosomal protein L40E
MRCSKCGTNNPSGNSFCAQCGTALTQACSKCNADNPPTSNFCGKCGAALTGGAGSPATASPTAEPTSTVRIAPEQPDTSLLDGERKTVTALFADIKGSMELMEDLDPEEARAIVDPALKLMIDAVHRYDGYIVQSTGDGIFALFGAPVAHEDHPQRALYAGLRIQDELKRYSDRLRVQGKLPLQARVGVNTGEVVVRSIATGDGHAEYTPIGHSTGLAARLQALAPIGSIAASQHTQRLCEGYFAFKSLGPTTVKGVSEPVNVFEVIGLGPLRTRLQVSAQRGLTRFVGRQAELGQMKHALELARAGHGQVLAAMGEAGVGKSRLVFEFKAIAQNGCLVLEAYSVSHGKASAYLPVIDLLHSYFGVKPGDDERTRREKVGGKTLMLDRNLEDMLPYLFALLGIVNGEDPLAQMDGQLRKRRTLEAIKRVLLRESLSQPLIVIFEDLHWIDEQTQEFLNMFTDSIGTARILLLVNYRPEYQHQWGSKTYYTQLRLDPLGKESAEEMLEALVGDSGELAPLKRIIIERTEGVPFFMEEIVQALHEEGTLARNGGVRLTRPLNSLWIPATVQAVLASRIDRLAAAEKELLQTLAVLGREFSLELVRRVTLRPDNQLEPMLWRLQAGEFIYEQPAAGDVEYIFKHALTQEVAYNALLAERRKLLHERAGAALESMLAAQPEDHLPELARHYSRSDNVAKAVEYLGRAGARAVQQTATSEAVSYLSQALELLKQLPESVNRDRQELDLLIALGPFRVLARGPAAAVEAEGLRARELCERLGDDAKLAEVLISLSARYTTHNNLPKAREAAEQSIALAERVNTGRRGATHSSLALVLYIIGDLDSARQHFERGVEFPDRERSIAGSLAPVILPTVLLLLGYPAAARTKGDKSLELARRLSDPARLVRALENDAMRHVLLRDSASAMQRAEAALSIAAEHEMAMFQSRARFYMGWALAAAGREEEGIPEMQQYLSVFGSAGALVPLFVALMAEHLRSKAHIEEGLGAVAEALGRVERTGERMAEAELYRVKGELLITRDPRDDSQAERCFITAIDIARAHKARWWELRATASFARLLKRYGKSEEARRMIAGIYNWFTEGFGTADLKDARALLDELNT